VKSHPRFRDVYDQSSRDLPAFTSAEMASFIASSTADIPTVADRTSTINWEANSSDLTLEDDEESSCQKVKIVHADSSTHLLTDFDYRSSEYLEDSTVPKSGKAEQESVLSLWDEEVPLHPAPLIPVLTPRELTWVSHGSVSNSPQPSFWPDGAGPYELARLFSGVRVQRHDHDLDAGIESIARLFQHSNEGFGSNEEFGSKILLKPPPQPCPRFSATEHRAELQHWELPKLFGQAATPKPRYDFWSYDARPYELTTLFPSLNKKVVVIVSRLPGWLFREVQPISPTRPQLLGGPTSLFQRWKMIKVGGSRKWVRT
ncbi:hypothetical protein HDU93_010108, partial [Gonapodya sp. JEL0774]